MDIPPEQQHFPDYSQQMRIVASYLDLSFSHQNCPQPPSIRNFVRDKLKDITIFINQKLNMTKRVTSWIEFAKLLFKFKYKYNSEPQWQQLRDLVDDVVQQGSRQLQYREYYGKVLQVTQQVERDKVKEVIRLIEQNQTKRRSLYRRFMNQARPGKRQPVRH